MCRWLANTGAPVLLTDMLYGPRVHSLIDQSLHFQAGGRDDQRGRGRRRLVSRRPGSGGLPQHRAGME